MADKERMLRLPCYGYIMSGLTTVYTKNMKNIFKKLSFMRDMPIKIKRAGFYLLFGQKINNLLVKQLRTTRNTQNIKS